MILSDFPLKKVSLLMCFFLAFFLKGYPDTLVSINDLTFNSDLEKEAFLHLTDEDSLNYPALYLAIDSSINKTKFQEILKRINVLEVPYRSHSFSKMKESKKIKKIYRNIHAELLKKYDEKVLFSSIFSNGEYQCVTSTMLYSLILHDLNIPFEIKLTPDHAYLVAYPKSENIIMETTNPLRGTVIYNDQFKTSYVESMHKMKIISDTEYKTESVNKLFNKYFGNPEIVTLKEIAGAQYHNKALFLLQNMQFKKAFEYMEKAYFLHPSKTNTYLLLVTLAATLDKVGVKNEHYAGYLAKIMRFQGSLISSDQLFTLFNQLTYQQLEYEGNVEMYIRSYHKILPAVKDSALQAEIKFVYNYERGRRLYNIKNYGEAMPFIKIAYGIKPKNLETEQMFINILVDKLSKSEYNKKVGKDLIAEMEAYTVKFPQLKNKIAFKKIYLLKCLDFMDKYYYEKDVSKGEIYRKKFEENYPSADYNFLSINKYIVHSYNSAGSCYFAKGNYKKSREIFKKGLFYVPDSRLLKNRLRIIE